MTNYYDDNAKVFFESTYDLDMKSLYNPFLIRIPKISKILDLGCGPGRDASYFKKLGHSVIAIDSSIELARIAKEKMGVDVEVRDFFSVDNCEEFDGIWACASLLHVPKKDLPRLFAKLEYALKPSGTVYCSFKYGDNDSERNGRHFSDFTEESFKRMLSESTKLVIRESWITEDLREDKKGERWLNLLLWK